MANDFYKTLGVSKDADDQEIKRAYRKLAREWHPDVAKDKPDAEQKFKSINEAYQVLSDKSKRAQYDQFGEAAFGGGSPNSAAGNAGQQGAGGFNPFGGGFGGQQSGPFSWSYSTSQDSQGSASGDPFDIFEQVFGFSGFGGQRKGRSVRYSLNIDFVDSIKGYEETINVDEHKLKVKLPVGVQDGTQVKFAGKGENPGNNIPPGDLYITINIKPHPDFARQGQDIFSVEEIDMGLAALGGKVEVKTIDSTSKTGFATKNVKIPSGTQPGAQVRLRGMGMPSSRGLGRGNHYVTIKVMIPQKLNKKQKEALKQHFND